MHLSKERVFWNGFILVVPFWGLLSRAFGLGALPKADGILKSLGKPQLMTHMLIGQSGTCKFGSLINYKWNTMFRV